MGNALVQALALGILKDKQEIRDVMRTSTKSTLYHPTEQDIWKQKRQQYTALKNG